MTNVIEKSGKTVEDALEAGLKELGLASSDVDIEVLEYGSPGLFGMFGKLARVKLTVKKRQDDFDFDMPSLSLEKEAAKPKKEQPAPAKKQPADKPKPEAVKPDKPIQEKPAKQKREKSESAAKPERAAKIEKAPKPKPVKKPDAQPAEPAKADNRPPMEAMTMEDLPPVDFDSLSDDAKKAYEFLLNTTKLMGVEVEIRVREKEGQLQIQMLGDTLGVLIGRRGETLDALQYLTSLRVNKGRDEYMRVTLDTEHYRAKREEALRRLAERMANRARKTARPVALEPMNPYERRVLHSALQDNEFVTTHSEGEDPYRRVIITLK